MDVLYCLGSGHICHWAILFRRSFGIPSVKDIVAAASAASLTSALHSNPSGPEEQGKPGYYKLNTKVLRKKGIPMYVYIGEDAPSDIEDDQVA